MQLPDTSLLTKANAIISVMATIVYIVGFACPYWLVKEFVLVALPPVVPADLAIDSNIGLVTSCKVVTSPLGTEPEDCSSDGAADWQTISAGLAIAALVLTVASCVFSVLIVVVPKLAKAHLLRLLTACLTFIAAGFIIAVLVIFQENKFIQVSPPHPQQEEYETGWAYLVTLASASAFVILVITTVLDFIWTKTRTGSS